MSLRPFFIIFGDDSHVVCITEQRGIAREPRRHRVVCAMFNLTSGLISTAQKTQITKCVKFQYWCDDFPREWSEEEKQTFRCAELLSRARTWPFLILGHGPWGLSPGFSSSVRRVLRENVVAVGSFVWRWPFGDDKDAEALPCKGTTLLKVMFRFRSILCGLFHVVPQRVCEGRTTERRVSTVLHGPASFLYLSIFPSKLDQTAFFFVICGKKNICVPSGKRWCNSHNWGDISQEMFG